MSKRSVTHASFTLERTFDASPARVFAGFADKQQKDKWFNGPPDWVVGKNELDFRVGGREVNIGGPKGGPMSAFQAIYQDIVPDNRIVYTYEMHLDDKRISVSLATIELHPAGAGTRLVLTEHGAYLDGWDKPELREQGMGEALDALGRSLVK